MKKVLRLIKLLTLIPAAPAKADTKRLATGIRSLGFESTIRTVQRDLVELSSAFPLRCDEGNPAGWSWTSASAQLPLSADPYGAALIVAAGQMPFAWAPFLLSYIDEHKEAAMATLRSSSDQGLKRWLKSTLTRRAPQL